MRRAAIHFTVLVLAAAPMAAQLLPCGTTEARQEQAERLRIWSEARQRSIMAKSATSLSNADVRDGVFVLPADDTTAPFRRPFNLEGRSLLFTRKSEQTFGRQNLALAYDDITGAIRQQPGDGYVTYNLKGFSFPFRTRNATQLYISGHNAIFLDTPPNPGVDQFNDAELAATKTAVIAPLWMTSSDLAGPFPDVYVKELSDRLVVSWIDRATYASFDVQATLFSNGDIRFSYKRATSVRGGGIVIGSGDDAWRNQQTTLLSATDPAGDVTSSPPALFSLLDIDSLTVARLADSNLLEFRIKTHGTQSQLASGDTIAYSVLIGDTSLTQFLSVSLTKDGVTTYSVPGWGSASGSPAARMENDTVVLDLLQDMLVGSLSNVPIRAYSVTPTNRIADVVVTTMTIDKPLHSARTDFAALTSDETSGPIEEAFTLPILSVGGVWSEIKNQYGLKDSDIDGLAVYQNFFTDIILYAGAYSTGGNAGATGIKISSSLGPNFPRTPALMHMNKLGYGWNATEANAGHVILHEFGHHWLLLINIMEDGKLTRVVDPVSAHPAQYVHTPAAFSVVGSTDASCMGGAMFTDNGNGTFTSPPFDNYSYSWLDLYLMGLADKGEVPPFYYIANSSPALGNEYYPPPQQAFSGTRNEVLMQQVVDAMGGRKPAYPSTQRQFRVFFVLLTDPDHPNSDGDLASVVNYRRILEKNFVVATGGRAAVTTEFRIPPPERHRAARH